MNILFLSIVRFLDINDRGIYTDLMRKFTSEGHNVSVVYPAERRFNECTELKIRDNVSLLRIKTLNIQKTNIIEKGVATIALESQFLEGIKKYFSNVKFDLVIYSTPPITFTKVIKYIKKRDSATSYLLLKDIFPQNAVDLGLLKENSLIHQYFKRKEHKLYECSDFIGCMSPANLDYILKNNPSISADKVEVNPNSIEPNMSSLHKWEKDAIRMEFGIPDDKIILVYGGNLGKPQGINFLIDVLSANKTNKDVFFVIVGDGTEFVKLSHTITTQYIDNAKLLKVLPKRDYDKLISSCDIGLIFLDPSFTIPNFPSRLLSYLEAKMPVISATDNNTDIGRIMENNEFGFWAKSGDLKTFNNILKSCVGQHEMLKEMGNKGYQFLLDNYQVSNSYKLIIDKFKNV